MDAIDLRALRDATFCGTDTEFYATATRKHVPSERERCSPDTLVHCLRRHLTVDSPRTGPPGMVDEKRHTTTLRYIFQNRRAHHVSGRPDPLPFKDGHTAEQVFELLSLPYSYFQIANGSLTVAEAAVHLDASGLPQTLDMIVHCISKGGDWALALSHDAAAGTTSAFCSVESCLGSADLLASVEALRGLSTHPMLIPCVMFAYILRNAVARRHAIKARLRVLERDIGLLSESLLRAAHDGHQEPHTLADSAVHIARLSDNLNSCRAEQGSREGRYHFWRSYHAALQKGFEYYGQILARDSRLYESESHARLLRWANLNWAQLQSLRTRDMDHVVKVNEASDMLYHLITQRDSRVQAAIARAAKRDSEDMRFMALLGSVFLPASLVATILNVPEFSFLPGARLFGVYIGVTLPLIAVVVGLCLCRRAIARWSTRKLV